PRRGDQGGAPAGDSCRGPSAVQPDRVRGKKREYRKAAAANIGGHSGKGRIADRASIEKKMGGVDEGSGGRDGTVGRRISNGDKKKIAGRSGGAEEEGGDPGGMGGRPAARSNEGSSNDHPEGARRKKPRLHRCHSKEGASAGAGPESIALRRRISPRRRLRRAAAVAAQAP